MSTKASFKVLLGIREINMLRHSLPIGKFHCYVICQSGKWHKLMANNNFFLRSLRLFDISTQKRIGKINKSTYPVEESSTLHGKTIRLFHDDTLLTFYRRFCFSPDGQLMYGVLLYYKYKD